MEDMRWMTQANYILWAAHNIERTADRVTNICERVVFVVTGKLVEISDDNFAWGEEIFLPSPPVPVGSMK